MVAPLAPHLAEELWQRLGHQASLAHGPFPVADEAYLTVDTVEFPVQVNGKLRSRVTAAVDADESTILALALADEKIKAAIAGKQIVKKIYVPGKLANIVVK